MFLFLKNNYKYVLFFLLTFFIVYFLLYFDLKSDALWEYGYSHAVRIGEIPYKDFNLITTPLFIYLFSIGLFVKDSFLCYLIEFSLLYTIMYYFLNKLLKNSTYIFIFFMFIFGFKAFIPSYNALCFVLIIIILYMVHENNSPYLIGFLVGLLLLSKHTIGGGVFLLSQFCEKDLKKIIKKIIGFIIPNLIFLTYLLINNSFMKFMDLCIFGLFDFKKNSIMDFRMLIILLFIICIYIYLIYKKKIDIKLFLYSLGSIMFIVPIVDASHFSFFFSIMMIPILINVQMENVKKMSIIFCFIFILFYFFVNINLYKNLVFSKQKHFENILVTKSEEEYANFLVKNIKKYNNKQIYIYDHTGMYLDIIMDREINYFSIALSGNYGFNGDYKMIKKIKRFKDTYFLISYDKYHYIKYEKVGYDQLDLNIIEYILDNSNEVDKIGMFNVYYMEE